MSHHDEPAVDGAGVDASAADAPVPSLELPLPKRRIWPLPVVLALIAVAGGLFAWRAYTAPHPLRVLVAVDVDGYWWEGSPAAAALADELGEHLGKMGFEPVRAGDPATAAILEDAESIDDAAYTLRAAFVIRARIKPEIVPLPVDGGFFEVRIDAPVTLAHVEAGAPLAETTIHTFSAAKEQERALRLAAQSAARHAFDMAVPAMLAHPSVAEIVSGSDAKLVDQLAPAVRYASGRAAELKQAAAQYVDLDAARRAQEKGGGILFHSPVDAEDSLLAVAGDRVLVGTGDVAPFYSPTQLEILRDTKLETLGWRRIEAADAAHDEGVWRGYNSFTYPTATRDGAKVALVEDLYGWARALTVVTAGVSERVRVDATHKLSEPRISPGGSALAYIDRACRSCPREVAVMDLTSKQELVRIDAALADAIGHFAWLDDTRLMVVYRAAHPSDDEPEQTALWGIDVRDGRRFTLLVGHGGASFGQPAASPDAKTIVAVNDDANAIVSLNMDDLSVVSHEVGGRPSAPAFSPDGRRVVFELHLRGREPDIAMLGLDASTVTRLTDNPSADSYPLFSSDGKRVFFEARDTDPVFPERRTVARIASVAVP